MRLLIIFSFSAGYVKLQILEILECSLPKANFTFEQDLITAAIRTVKTHAIRDGERSQRGLTLPARILVKISLAYISFPLGMRTLHHSCGVLMRACSQYFKSFYNRPAISFREVSQCPLCSIVVHSKGSLSHLEQLHTGRVLFSNENNSQIYEHAWKSREKIHWKSPCKRC